MASIFRTVEPSNNCAFYVPGFPATQSSFVSTRPAVDSNVVIPRTRDDSTTASTTTTTLAERYGRSKSPKGSSTGETESAMLAATGRIDMYRNTGRNLLGGAAPRYRPAERSQEPDLAQSIYRAESNGKSFNFSVDGEAVLDANVNRSTSQPRQEDSQSSSVSESRSPEVATASRLAKKASDPSPAVGTTSSVPAITGWTPPGWTDSNQSTPPKTTAPTLSTPSEADSVRGGKEDEGFTVCLEFETGETQTLQNTTLNHHPDAGSWVVTQQPTSEVETDEPEPEGLLINEQYEEPAELVRSPSENPAVLDADSSLGFGPLGEVDLALSEDDNDDDLDFLDDEDSEEDDTEAEAEAEADKSSGVTVCASC